MGKKSLLHGPGPSLVVSIQQQKKKQQKKNSPLVSNTAAILDTSLFKAVGLKPKEQKDEQRHRPAWADIWETRTKVQIHIQIWIQSPDPESRDQIQIQIHVQI